jgi:hypothetical protein
VALQTFKMKDSISKKRKGKKKKKKKKKKETRQDKGDLNKILIFD